MEGTAEGTLTKVQGTASASRQARQGLRTARSPLRSPLLHLKADGNTTGSEREFSSSAWYQRQHHL
jgi:hypothetical protein